MMLRWPRFALYVGLCLGMALWQPPASAQTPAEVALAREQFTLGVEAARSAEWPAALAAFERSYALYAHPETLFNIAGARQKLGQWVAASEAYRAYLRKSDADKDLARRAQAEARLQEITPQIARVGIRVEDMLDGDLLTLDGQILSRAALAADLPIDPGEHTLRLLAGAEVVAETAFAIHARERIEVLLKREQAPLVPAAAAQASTPTEAVVAMPAPTDVPRPDRATHAHRPLWRNGWLWAAVGVVAAGGVTAFIVARRDPEQEPEVKGNVGTGVVEIR